MAMLMKERQELMQNATAEPDRVHLGCSSMRVERICICDPSQARAFMIMRGGLQEIAWYQGLPKAA